jgi:hypothetical protein
MNLNLPKSATTVSKILLKAAAKVKRTIKKEIATLLANGQRFGITFDEWTSRRNRRYINVNVHKFKKHWNLGLIRIVGDLPADKLLAFVEKRLSEFGLNIHHDIISATTDGASVMLKLGRLAPFLHQVCLVHGFHLAVTKVILIPSHYSCFQKQISIAGTVPKRPARSSN